MAGWWVELTTHLDQLRPHLQPPHAVAMRSGQPQVGLLPHTATQDFDLESDLESVTNIVLSIKLVCDSFHEDYSCRLHRDYHTRPVGGLIAFNLVLALYLDLDLAWLSCACLNPLALGVSQGWVLFGERLKPHCLHIVACCCRLSETGWGVLASYDQFCHLVTLQLRGAARAARNGRFGSQNDEIPVPVQARAPLSVRWVCNGSTFKVGWRNIWLKMGLGPTRADFWSILPTLGPK